MNAGRTPAPCAADPAATRGRLYDEPPSATRNDFRRDCDRIIHSTAFRRLAHKTQVFVYHEGDHYRTRLTHTLEVTQIARALARALGINEDLAEACALAHDLGHPPFGHSGEHALDQCLAGHGGFDHNAQTLSVVTRLERRYAGFDGLNLTYETLEGLVKHNGPLTDTSGRAIGRHAAHGVAQAILDYNAVQDLELALYPSAEAQAGAIADDIAYDAHDIDDGLRARMFTIDELAALPLIGDILAEIEKGLRTPPYPRSQAGRGGRGSSTEIAHDQFRFSLGPSYGFYYMHHSADRAPTKSHLSAHHRTSSPMRSCLGFDGAPFSPGSIE